MAGFIGRKKGNYICNVFTAPGPAAGDRHLAFGPNYRNDSLVFFSYGRIQFDFRLDFARADCIYSDVMAGEL
jgi:hypothetical protein